MEFLYKDVIFFLLISFRISGLFFFTPFFSSNTIPVKVKLGFVFFTVVLIFNFVPKVDTIFTNLGYYELSILAIKELLIGFIIGYLLLTIFSVVQTAAQVYSMDMGFAMVNVFDPISQVQIPVLGQFKYLFVLAMFFLFGVHRKILFLLINSFYKYKIGTIDYSANGMMVSIIDNFSYFFILAIKMALPVLGVLFLMDVILGVMARIAPQMNVFFVGMPLKIMIGFLVLILFTPYMIMFFKFLLETGFERIAESILRILGS